MPVRYRALQACLLACLCGCLANRCGHQPEVDTDEASTFKEAGFARLAKGTSLAGAEAAAGTPMLVACAATGAQSWHYTTQATGAQAFEERVLLFDADGRLAGKISRVTSQESELPGTLVTIGTTRDGPQRAQDACRHARPGD